MKYGGKLVLASLALALGGCGGLQDISQLLKVDTKSEELAAVRNAPLAIPPDYTLRPPRGGESRKGGDQAQQRGRQMLTGTPSGTVVLKDRSAGENELLRLAGLRPGVDARIRAEVDRAGKQQVEAEQVFVDKLLKWKEDGGPEGAEAEDEGFLPKLGGDTRPVIKRKGEF